METMVKRSAAVLALFSVFALPLSAHAGLMEITSLFVFGDSLSDGGNSGLRTQQYTNNPNIVFPPPPYYNGQYSNGPVAVEYLWNRYNPGNPGGFRPSLAGGTNYAIGGATTGSASFNSVNSSVPDFLKPAYANYSNAWQLQSFADQLPSFNPATSLFVLWLFPNDIFYSGATGMLPGLVPGSPGGTDLISNGIANILTTIGTLAQAGAEHFLVPNMADLGLTPAFAGTPQADSLSVLTDTFNSNLAAQLTALDAMLSAEIVQFDTAGSFARILADPLAYGFDNTTDSCVANLANGLCNPGNWDRWLFWDGVHPTTHTHQVLASQFAMAVPEPSSVALLVIALLALFVITGRRSNPHGSVFYTPRYRANFSGARASSVDWPSSTTRPFSSTTQRSVCASTER
jgi:phospholipase/lecithinase/hemolysin